MPIRALALDIQGTLMNLAIQDKKTQKIYRQSVDGRNTVAYQQMYSSLFDENPGYQGISVINGISVESTIRQLQALVENGVLIYLATGDGAKGSHREKGAMGVLEVQELLSENDIPTKIANWEALDAVGFPKGEGFDFEGKNPLLRYIIRDANLTNADELLFLDDGQPLTTKAKKLGFLARHINMPQDLTDGLQYAIDNAAVLATSPTDYPVRHPVEAVVGDDSTPRAQKPPEGADQFQSLLPILGEYRQNRAVNAKKYYGISFFSKLFGGYSKSEKLGAIDALMHAIQNDDMESFTADHLKVLRQGSLNDKIKSWEAAHHSSIEVWVTSRGSIENN